MVTLPEENGLPWKPIERKEDKWPTEESRSFTPNLPYPLLRSSPRASQALPLVQPVAEGRQSSDTSILFSLLLGLAPVLLVVALHLLVPEQAAWVVGPRPPTGILQPAVILLERVLGVERPRLESDERCGVINGGQVRLG